VVLPLPDHPANPNIFIPSRAGGPCRRKMALYQGVIPMRI